MKRLLILGLACVAGAAQAGQLFYGGDFDGRNGLRSQEGGNVSDSRVYDNFMLGSSSNITDVYGNFLDSTNGGSSSAFWEIRTGVSLGNGGTVVAGGVMGAATTKATGRSGFGLNEYTYDIKVSGVTLNAGTMYWLTVAPDMTGLGSVNIFLSTTGGANGVGGPLGDGNSYWDSTTFGKSFANPGDALGAGTWDFSLGVNGSPVPEPATFAVLGLGALALIKRRRK